MGTRHVLRRVRNGLIIEAPAAAVKRLRLDADVVRVEPDVTVRLSGAQIAPPWGLDRSDQADLPLDASYDSAKTGMGVRVYVLDTGVAPHQDFGSRLLPGWTAFSDGNGTDDCHGHGTHVAGTVGGVVHGIAKEVGIIPVRVLGCDGTGNGSDVLAALDWILAQPSTPSVVNMSLGTKAAAGTEVLDAAVREVIDAGITVVAAAGNDGADACLYSPGRIEQVLTVGATRESDARAGFSNHGRCLDLFAPGNLITSTGTGFPGATTIMSGTSMASPHAAGVVAQHLQADPLATPAEVVTAMRAAATQDRVTGPGDGSPNLLLRAFREPTVVEEPLPDEPAAEDPLPEDSPRAAPDAPEAVTATAGDLEATVTWAAPRSDGGSAVTGYTVSVDPSGRTLPADAADRALSIPDLVNGTSYRFSVTATNAVGSGTPSTWSNAVTPRPPGPVAFDGDATTTRRVTEPRITAAAVEVSLRRFVTVGDASSAHARARHVVLSRDDAFPDSLAGASLTATGPLLFTASTSLPAATASEIRRVLPGGATVYLLGGDAAISATVATEVAASASPPYRVVRLAGPSRVETSLRIAEEVRRLHPDNRDVLVARAYGAAGNETSGWADSITGGAYGASTGTPVVLTPTESLHGALAEWVVGDNPSRSIVLGGTAAVSDAVVTALPRSTRLSGRERTETAAAVADGLWGIDAAGARRFVVMNGFDTVGWAHGLAAAGIAADARAPILMVTPDVSGATASLLSTCGAPAVELFLIGHTAAMPDSTVEELDRLDGEAC